MLSRFSAVDSRRTFADAGFEVTVIQHLAFDLLPKVPM